MGLRWKWAVGFTALSALWVGCPKSTDKCTFVGCPPGSSCDKKDGVCKGGTDAGVDAGSACGTCPAATPLCVTATLTCVTCTATAGCNALAPVCDTSVAGGQCVQCLSSGDCPPLTPICEPTTRTCQAPDSGVVTNDDCASPSPLAVTPGNTVIVFGTTNGATNSNQPSDISPTCSNTARLYGPDVVYSLHLPTAQDVIAVATPTATSQLQPVLYMRPMAQCDAGAAVDELACVVQVLGTDATLGLPSVPAGDYALWVDSAAGTAGDFSLQVTLGGPSSPPANDSCLGAIPIVLDAGGVGHVNGNTFAATNSNAPTDTSPSCDFDSSAIKFGRDVVYSYQLPATGKVDVTVSPVDGGFLPVIYARAPGQCASGLVANEVNLDPLFNTFPASCADSAAANPPGGAASLTGFDQPAGTYFLWVDGAERTSGPFSLDFKFTPPPSNDGCPAIALVFDGGVATVHGDTSAAHHTAGMASTCDQFGTLGKELIYSFVLPPGQDRDVLVTITPDPGAPTDLLGSITTAGACGPGTELVDPLGRSACNTYDSSVGNTNFYAVDLPASALPYHLWVESLDHPGGGFTATVQLLAPSLAPPNDTCPGAAIVLPVAGLVGTTLRSTTLYTGACPLNNFANPGPSVVYSFTTTMPGKLTAQVTPTPNPFFLFRPNLFLRDAADCTAVDTTGALACAVAPLTASATALEVPNLAPGDYSLIVAGADFTFGAPFTLDATLDAVDPLQTNTSCGTAINIPSNADSYDVVGQTDDAGSHTRFPCSADAGFGSNVVYQFTTPTGGPFNARVDLTTLNADAFLPVLALRSNCAGTGVGDQLICTGSNGDPYDAIGMALGLDGGSTYSVWVGSNGSAPQTEGPFDLHIDIAPPPPNDRCPNATPLPPNTSVSGTTLGAVNDFDQVVPHAWYSEADAGSNGCSPSSDVSGPDVVYVYTAPANGKAVFTLTPQYGFSPSLAVLSSCAQRSCLDFQDGTSQSGPKVSTVSVRAGARYYVVVDSTQTSRPASPADRGGYTLSVTQ